MKTHGICGLCISTIVLLCQTDAGAQTLRSTVSNAFNGQQVYRSPEAAQGGSADGSASQAFRKQLRDLKKTLQNAKSAEEKTQVKSSINKALSEYFDSDMEHRRSELARLKKRAEDMASLLAKRATAKEGLVGLQLKSIKHDADGLGLFSEQPLPQALNPYATAAVPLAVAAASDAASSQRFYEGSATTAGTDPKAAALKRVQEARRKLRGADDEPKVVAELKAALEEYFDRDLEFRKKELEDVNKGLKISDERLQKRAGAKDEIVDLQQQLVVNEAEGLGFFSGTDATATQTSSFGQYPSPSYGSPRAAR